MPLVERLLRWQLLRQLLLFVWRCITLSKQFLVGLGQGLVQVCFVLFRRVRSIGMRLMGLCLRRRRRVQNSCRRVRLLAGLLRVRRLALWVFCLFVPLLADQV